jgi:hypothetical protein
MSTPENQTPDVETLDLTDVAPDPVALANPNWDASNATPEDLEEPARLGPLASPAVGGGALLNAFKRWRITATEVSRGGVLARNHHRPQSYGDMHGILQHHTGPFSTVSGMLALLWDGRSDLPGPLCTYSTAPDGHVYLISGGRANHAGAGGQNVYNALIADAPTPRPGADVVDGNAHLYGNEIMSAGSASSIYPDVQVQAAVRAAAAICELHKWKGTSVIRHGDWTARKVDTAGKSQHGDVLSTSFWHSEVARALKVGPAAYTYPATAPKPPTPKTTLTDADVAAIVAAVVKSGAIDRAVTAALAKKA